MIVPPSHQVFLSEVRAVSICVAGSNLVPEVIRCVGLKFEPVEEIMTCYVPQKFFERVIPLVEQNPKIAIVASEVASYETYQYKGTYLLNRTCSQDEHKVQFEYMNALTEIIASFGLSKEKLMRAYFHQPSFALVFKVEEVFDQTPKLGNGQKIEAVSLK